MKKITTISCFSEPESHFLRRQLTFGSFRHIFIFHLSQYTWQSAWYYHAFFCTKKFSYISQYLKSYSSKKGKKYHLISTHTLSPFSRITKKGTNSGTDLFRWGLCTVYTRVPSIGLPFFFDGPLRMKVTVQFVLSTSTSISIPRLTMSPVCNVSDLKSFFRPLP